MANGHPQDDADNAASQWDQDGGEGQPERVVYTEACGRGEHAWLAVLGMRCAVRGRVDDGM